jgi:fucose 4-O-acetylase-like acetyltransferase
MAAATPPDRDRHMDFLRVFSIAVVVLGHWLIAVVVWRDGHVEGTNALEVIDGLQIATWVLQVMPVFFFVGGFANLRTWRAVRRDGGGYARFLHGRLVRMLRPTLVFLGVALTVTVILDALNVADNVVFPASTLITRPLWFLGVYMIVVALTPLAVRLHDRLGVGGVLALAAAAAIVDGLRFGAGISAAGHFNYATVWLLAHQLGFVYADGLLTARRARAMAVSGLAGMVALVGLGPYPVSMVGLGTDEFSNMDPPTLAIVALAVWQVGLVTVLRDPMSSWLRRLRVWAGVIFVNSVIMTMFLWHLTAMLLGIGILYPLGWPQPDAGTAQWWALRPVWVAALLVVLSVFVLAFGRFERRGFGGRAEPSPGTGSDVAAALAAVLVILGLLGFAIGGMHQLFSTEGTELIIIRLNPFQNVVHLALGLALLRASVGPAAATRRVLLGVGAGLAILAVTGAILARMPESNVLAVNAAGTVVHAALALAALAASMRRAT